MGSALLLEKVEGVELGLAVALQPVPHQQREQAFRAREGYLD
jgi:hypothetical protein